MNPAELAAALGKARHVGREWQCLCPAHNDHDPSLSITQGKDGKLVFICRAGCSNEDVVEQLKTRGLWAKPGPRNRIVATYPYHDENGNLLFEVVRFEPKSFSQRRPDGIGGWIWKLEDVRRVPYRLSDLIAAKGTGNGQGWRVYICEGEKDADRLRKQWGLVATTNPGGAGKWRGEYNEYFSGADAVILADNDEAGRKHAVDVAAQIKLLATNVRICQVRGKYKDISNWIDDGLGQSDLDTIVDDVPAISKWERPVRGVALLGRWMSRDIQPPDFLLGEVFSTTSRLMLYAKTGLGKTSISLAVAMAIAGGPGNFLHWRISRAGRVLYIDGEMSLSLMKSRLVDAVRRHGAQPDTMFILSREDFPDMEPLNTEKGQQFVDAAIEELGGIDAIFFDNIQALLVGNHREPEAWAAMLPWCRDLTRRRIGQFWIHHTGWDGSHGYGDSTREWQLDTVVKLSPPEVAEDQPQPEGDIVFKLEFDKARDRTPENRPDFSPGLIQLKNDRWISERIAGQNSGQNRSKPFGRPNKLEDIALRALDDALAVAGEPTSHPKIPSEKLCVPRDLWFRYFQQSYVGDGDPEVVRKAFRRQAEKLQAAGRVSSIDGRIWR